MTVSPQVNPQVGKVSPARYEIIGLLAELRKARTENRKLRRRIVALETGRARWRAEARAWKWGMLSCRPRKSA